MGEGESDIAESCHEDTGHPRSNSEREVRPSIQIPSPLLTKTENQYFPSQMSSPDNHDHRPPTPDDPPVPVPDVTPTLPEIDPTDLSIPLESILGSIE
jgi:hypothetical protein